MLNENEDGPTEAEAEYEEVKSKWIQNKFYFFISKLIQTNLLKINSFSKN